MKLIRFGVIGVALLLAGAARAQETYELDKNHSKIGFAVAHLVISEVEGRFNEFEGSVTLDAAKAVTEAKATIQAKSIDTGVSKRDDHLRSGDFFDAEKFPTITFASKKVEKDGDKNVLVGDFTMHGVTKEIRLPYTINGPIKDPQGGSRIGIAAETTINRKDYGLTWNKVLETGGVAVGEDVKISIKAEAVTK